MEIKLTNDEHPSLWQQVKDLWPGLAALLIGWAGIVWAVTGRQP